MRESKEEKEDPRLEKIEILVDNLIEDLPKILRIRVEERMDAGERLKAKEELREKMVDFLTLLLKKDTDKDSPHP